jgi:hypothetical protein
MIDQPKPGRRHLLAMLTTLPALAPAGSSLAAPALAATAPPVAVVPFPEGARLLVAGPNDGTLNRWADALLPALEPCSRGWSATPGCSSTSGIGCR